MVLAGAPAAIGKPAAKPRVAPASATLTTPITVTWKTKRSAKRGVTYAAELFITNRDGLACSTDAGPVPMRATKTGFAATIKPPAQFGAKQWCPGGGHVRIWRNGPGKLSKVLARGAFTVTVGAGQTAPGPQPGVPAKVTLLGGSTLTASAAGPPGPLGPAHRDPARHDPEQVHAQHRHHGRGVQRGAHAVPVRRRSALPGDSRPPTSIDSVSTSKMTLLASGQAQFDLVLNDSASQIFGCGPAGAPTATTTLPLSGKVGPDGLLKLNITGSVGAIDLPGGSQGGLAANLVLNVDLSGKG